MVTMAAMAMAATATIAATTIIVRWLTAPVFPWGSSSGMGQLVGLICQDRSLNASNGSRALFEPGGVQLSCSGLLPRSREPHSFQTWRKVGYRTTDCMKDPYLLQPASAHGFG